jgi:Cu(I)/Ag(I) efflux system membrane fusion protein
MAHRISWAVAIVAIGAILLAGCNSQQAADNTPATADDHHADHDHDHADHPHADSDGASDTVKATLAKLSPEDRASAEKQQVCAVSGEQLGTMGVPLKVDVNGRDVWVCCESCQDPLLENPEKYLAKLESE